MNSDSARRRAMAVLRFAAFDIDGYREGFARLAGCVAGALDRPQLGAEMLARGMTHRSLSSGSRLLIGRNVIINAGRGKIELGNGCRIGHFSYLGADFPGGLIRVGANSHIDTHAALLGQGRLTIGDNCAIGPGVTVHTQTNRHDGGRETAILNQGVVHAPVTIGDDVWFGAGVRVLPGATIGTGAVVGAGAVVRGELEPYTVSVGVPAKKIGSR